MNYKNLGYFVLGTIVGTTTALISAFSYIDYKVTNAQHDYQRLIKKEFSNAKKEIRTGTDKISTELEQKIDKEIKKIKEHFGIKK